ncbi:helitron helicase-like domain-containing protein [Artemisia annua]|uniref:Helitron helicase-like domain-containing protein n=1 Tax=Artemisia annua TaxID=35608 RepID=A0A2U1PAX2_ARTAN|nr:helitron helicase-like domain-containing protein [Artemisia annua]
MLSTNSGCSVAAFPVYQGSAASMPVQVTTVDGLVSTFTISNILPRVSDNTQYSAGYEGSSTSQAAFRIGDGSSVTPMVLDFSAAVTSNVNMAPAQILTAATRRIRQRISNASASRGPMHSGVAREPVNRQRGNAGRFIFTKAVITQLDGCVPYLEQAHGVNSNNLPAHGPIAPPQREGAPIEYKYFGRCDQVCQHCHATFWLEEKRTGLPASAAPQYQRCCVGGRAVLRTHRHYPAYIIDLFSDRHFMDNISAYNQTFAMTSFGATIDNSINTGRGPYVFRVSGQIYHWIGGFCPPNDDTPRFLQMYIYDTEHEVQNRLSHFDPHERQSLREDVIEGLIEFLDDNNALVRLFRTARDKLREADIPTFHIWLFGVVGANQYELPTADTIRAIVYDGGPESATDYDVVIERHSREPESVNKLHPQYMALQFPLLLIYGEEGYHLNLTLKNSDPFDTQHEKK